PAARGDVELLADGDDDGGVGHLRAGPLADGGPAARGRCGWTGGGGVGEAGGGVGAGGDGDAAGADDRRAEAAGADQKQDAGEQGDGLGGHAETSFRVLRSVRATSRLRWRMRA